MCLLARLSFFLRADGSTSGSIILPYKTCARGARGRAGGARGGVGRLYPTNFDGTPGDDAEAPLEMLAKNAKSS